MILFFTKPLQVLIFLSILSLCLGGVIASVAGESKGVFIEQITYDESKLYPTERYTWKINVEIIVNNNLCPNTSREDLFFFKLYVDNSLWWNEYNDTDYKFWNCSRNSTVTRKYIIKIPTWLGANYHLFRIELFRYDNITGIIYFEDEVSFMTICVLQVNLRHQTPLSYLSIYAFTIFISSVYLSAIGRIRP